MSNVLEYKGYFAKIEYSAEDQVLCGKIEGIKDLVNFESSSADQIEQEFHAAVDDYLKMCEELGEAPDKSYSGTFNIRIDPILHRKIAMQAIKSGESLNKTVEKAIESYLNPQIGYVTKLPLCGINTPEMTRASGRWALAGNWTLGMGRSTLYA